MSISATDLEVLRSLAGWLQQQRPAWLCTIVETIGSSPRPVGSLMACDQQGHTVGSLSGGCVEEELVAELCAQGAAQREPVLRRAYGVTAEENERLGLPCGGRLEILVEYFGERDERSAHVAELVGALERRQSRLRQVELGSGATSLYPASVYRKPELDGEYYRQTFAPRYRMLLVGAGQLSAVLARLAEELDYRVQICDPREQMAANWSGPDSIEVSRAMPDDFVREAVPDEYTVVITLTHDPRIDDMALMEALQHDAFYVGALGSQRTTERRLARLAQLDLSEQQIAALHAPVGLELGSKRPLEIAIAILAELTALRNGRRFEMSCGHA